MNWRLRAACRTADPSLFFTVEGERPHAAQVREATAKAICAECPVRRQCGSYAVLTPVKWGIWGGLGEDERALIRRRYLRHLRGYERGVA